MTSIHSSTVCGLALVLVAALLLVSVAGCGSVQVATSGIDMGKRPEAPPETVLAPGDTLEVRFYYTPEMNVTQAVMPDGTISLQLVGEVKVAGLTPAALREELQGLYKDKLVKPEVTVIVRSQQARRVFIGGEVKNPGLVPMPAEMTLAQALMLAGGPTPDTAQVSNVIVVRYVDGKRVVGSVDMRPSLGMAADGSQGGQPFYLRPLDVVYVPETKIVRADRWVDQHINKIIPVTGFRISTTTGNTTIGYETTLSR